ncbi:MAG: type II and III secretion system protein family protein, partial [Nitrospirae bacterium]|nr:type II and III secretion system protein family protein [Nitrospirota bacterium]
IKDNIREQISKFPLLGDIPILGALFRSSQYQKNETELIILVTLHLVKPLDKANQPLPGDKFLDPNDFEFFLDGQTEGAPKMAKANNTKNRKDSVRLSRGPVMNLTKGGLDGEFGYLLP